MPVYHVDSMSGDDGRDGKSPDSAFRSLKRATQEDLKPGDCILLKRGGAWAETLMLKGRGQVGAQITVGAYGEGPRPRIVVREGHGVSAQGPISGWRIGGIEIAGEKPFSPRGKEHGKNCGIYLSQKEPCEALVIEDCLIHDVDGHGILLTAGESEKPVFQKFGVLNCEIYNASTGISFGGPWPAPANATSLVQQFRVARCHVHDIGTDGIVLSHCRDGVIEYCTAFRTGLGRTKRSPVGIWFFMAYHCLIQYCESYDNHTAGNTADGGGFDLDGGCIECTMQYNYSHDNDGAGYLICSYDPKAAPCERCVTRFNISVNDGLANDYPAILFWQADNCQTYNNTCITKNSSALKFTSDTKGHLIANNIFVVDSSRDIPAVKSAFAVDKNNFRNNLYWRTKGAARFELGEQKTLDFEAFRKLVDSRGEIFADPHLSAMSGKSLHLLSRSPAVGTGMIIPEIGESDFYGMRPRPALAPNIGCSLRMPV